jgi:hypothetical protein
MTICTSCGVTLTPLETHGDYDCPMCWTCDLAWQNSPWNIEIFVHETTPDGVIHLKPGRDYNLFFDIKEGTL